MSALVVALPEQVGWCHRWFETRDVLGRSQDKDVLVAETYAEILSPFPCPKPHPDSFWTSTSKLTGIVKETH